MKRLTLIIAAAFVATLLMASVALAQTTMEPTNGGMMGGTTMEPTNGGMMGGTTMEPTNGGMMGGTTMEPTNGGMMGGTTMEPTASGGGATSGLPTSGGPAILLPAAALLLGSGILTYAVLRRR